MSKSRNSLSSRSWILIALALVAVVAVALSWWALTNGKPESDQFSENDFRFRRAADGQSVSVIKYEGTATEVTVPTTAGDLPVVEVEGLAFSFCKKMESVVIPEGVTAIGNGAFYNCAALESITFPASLTKWGQDLFLDCVSLTQIHVAEGNTVRRSVDGVLYSEDGTTLVRYPSGRTATDFTLPEGVTTVGVGAFENAGALIRVALPTSVTRVEEKAFFFCTSLSDITLPAGLTHLGSYAFANCSALKVLDIPTGITALPNHLFYNCVELTRVTLPDGLTALGECAFQSCQSMETITLPASLTSFDVGALMECVKLKALTVPTGTTYLPEFLCGYGLALGEVDIPASVTEIHENAFSACSDDLVLVGEAEGTVNTFAKTYGLKFRARGTDEVIEYTVEDED